MTRDFCPDCGIIHLTLDQVDRLPDCFDPADPPDPWQVEVVQVAEGRL